MINYVHQKEQKNEPYSREDIAASFTEAVCDVLSSKATDAACLFGEKKLVVAGGVSANSFLRERLEKDCEKRGIALYLPELRYCGDNAAMIAAQGYFEYNAGKIAGPDLNAYANMSIEDPIF